MIEGRYCDGHSSAAHPARLHVEAGVVRVSDLAAPVEAPLASLVVSERIGNIPRRITFADGATFETRDNDAVDALLALRGDGGFGRALSRWERLWGPAIGSLVAVVLISVLFVQFGIPELADLAAAAIPPSIDRTIGTETLDFLDQSLLEPSTLPQERREELQAIFDDMVTPLAADGHAYRLELRHGGRVGANAFALPAGIIVVTDELVDLAQANEEIMAVIAHEIGHVRGRHALRLLLRNAGIAAISLALIGDVSTVASLAAAAPAALLNARNSRELETEADDYAYDWLDRNGIPRRYFADILRRLEERSHDTPYNWLSSHPPAAQRIRN